GGVEDAPAPLRLHGRNDSLAHQERALEVYVQVPIPYLFGEGLDGATAGRTGVIHKDINASVDGDRLAHEPAHRVRVADITVACHARPAVRRPLAGDVLQQVGPNVGRDGRDALRCQRRGDLPADPPARPGDDGYLAAQIDVHTTLFVARSLSPF